MTDATLKPNAVDEMEQESLLIRVHKELERLEHKGDLQARDEVYALVAQVLDLGKTEKPENKENGGCHDG